jgi:voltage-gated potassium channel
LKALTVYGRYKMTDNSSASNLSEQKLAPTHHPSYLIFILVLSIIALLVLAVETIFKIDASTRQILEYADYAICAIFFLDFLLMLYKAENKVKYFVTWGWLDLLSSVPVIDSLRWGRAARIMRIFRVLRGIKAARIATKVIIERRAQNVFLAVLLVSIILVAVSSISVLHFETTADRTIKSPEDAVWWALVTITTVGYGDKFPVTTEGRVVAVILMFAGVGLFGTFSGFIASWFLGPCESQKDFQIVHLEKELSEIKGLLEDIKKNRT